MLNALKNLYHTNRKAQRQLLKAYGYLKNCKRILDVGCGTGEFVKLDQKRIVGVDNNRKTVQFCSNQGLKVVWGMADKLPFKLNSFEGLHCSHVIEHLNPKEAHAFLDEAGRVLKKNGILVISSPIAWSGFYDNLTHVKPYPPRALLRYLTEEAPDTSLPRLKTKFAFVDLYWRYRHFTQTGYTLVVRKVK